MGLGRVGPHAAVAVPRKDGFGRGHLRFALCQNKNKVSTRVIRLCSDAAFVRSVADPGRSFEPRSLLRAMA